MKWSIVPMGTLCSIQSGKSDTKDAVSDGPYAFFDRSKTVKRSSRFLRDCEALIIPGEGTEFLPRHFVGKFDLHQRAYALFDFRPEIDPRFLFYFLHHSADYFPRVAVGATVKSLRLRHFEQLPVSVTDISNQRRIVSILDEAFEGIATAKANAEQNLQNVHTLFESHLQSVFTQRGDAWAKTTLGQATGGVFTGPFGSLLHKSDYVENGIPLVNPAHITAIGIEPDFRKTVSEATVQKLSSYVMRKGDIVIGRRGEMGRCALVTDIEDGWLCGTGSFFIKPSPRCDSGYLVRFLRSDACKQRLEKIAGGAVMPNLSNTDLSNLSFDLPSPGEQRAICNAIDEVAAETQRLESIYQRKLAALDDLKKSLLQQAFTGQL